MKHNFFQNVLNKNIMISFLESWLDRGALINVDVPGCGTSAGSRPDGHK